MKLLDLTLDSAGANLALDEALLETAEAADEYPEVLRLWEPTKPFVVLGRSSPIESEVNLDFCRERKIDVLRRCSGGATIVTGPGCLMYAVLLDYRKRLDHQQRQQLRPLAQAHRFVMEKNRSAILKLGIETQLRGTSDLTYGNQKFSGNSMRSKRNWMIYHGTIIGDFDLALVSNCLGVPQRQPEYRRGRSHADFLTRLPTNADSLRQVIAEQWSATETLPSWPDEMTDQLLGKYRSEAWTYKVR
jgi:lipoate-protein ligase A